VLIQRGWRPSSGMSAGELLLWESALLQESSRGCTPGSDGHDENNHCENTKYPGIFMMFNTEESHILVTVLIGELPP